MSLTTLKALFREKIKVLAGGPLGTVTRGAGLIEVLDALASDTVLAESITLVAAQQLAPSIAAGRLYLITGNWNATGTTSTVYVEGLSPTAFNRFGVVLIGGVLTQVTVDIAAGTFAPVAADADVFLGDWNPVTNTPALVQGVGVKGSYYRVSAKTGVFKQIAGAVTASNVIPLSADSGVSSGLAIGHAMITQGVPANRLITEINSTGVVVSGNVSLPAGRYALFSQVVLGLTDLLVDTFLYFNGTAWVNRRPGLPIARINAPGAVQAGTGTRIGELGEVHSVLPDYTAEQVQTAGGGTLGWSSTGMIVLNGPGNAPSNWVLPGVSNFSTLALQLGRIQAIRCKQPHTRLTCAVATDTIDGAQYLHLAAGDTVWLRRVSAGWEIVLDARQRGLYALPAQTGATTISLETETAGAVLPINSATPVTVYVYGSGVNALGPQPLDTVYIIAQDGPGQITLAPAQREGFGTVPTLRFAPGAGLKTAGQYGSFLYVRQIALDEWVVTGGVA